MTGTALVTGASAGFGRALARALVSRGWRVIGTGRRPERLRAVAVELGANFVAVPGDVTDAEHRRVLAGRVEHLDLLVNNASALGPMPELATYPLTDLRAVFEANVVAPLALVQAVIGKLDGGTVVDVSSDAAREPYARWGGYGASKAALDQLTAVLAIEQPGIRCYAFDPGDMRTEMHQAAFPGADISDRPEPDASVPALLHLVETRAPSGRYTAAQFAEHVR